MASDETYRKIKFGNGDDAHLNAKMGYLSLDICRGEASLEIELSPEAAKMLAAALIEIADVAERLNQPPAED